MIDAQDIARAEQVLRVIHQGGAVDYPRQLEAMRVEQEAFDNWLTRRTDVIKARYRQAYYAADPRLHSAYNTLFMHAFLTGLVAGRHQEQEIV